MFGLLLTQFSTLSRTVLRARIFEFCTGRAHQRDILRAMNRWLARTTAWAREIKRDVVALWIAARDPRTPILAKVMAGVVAAYALSPIDLIPDFVPVLGYLDDLLIVPLGIMLAIRLVPQSLMIECRAAATQHEGRPVSRVGFILVVTLWLIATGSLAAFLWPRRHALLGPVTLN